jgi:hypothetical protein
MSLSTRWGAVILSSFAPTGPEGLVQREGEVDWAGAFDRFLHGLNTKARIGVRLGVVIVMTAPLWTFLCWGSFARLSSQARVELLQRLLVHRLFVVRELTLMLKVAACMAMFQSSVVLARTSFDPPSDSPRSSGAGVDERVRLPIAVGEGASVQRGGEP